MNIVGFALVAALAQAPAQQPARQPTRPAAQAAQPNPVQALSGIDCPLAATPAADRQLIGALAGRGGAQPSPHETAAQARFVTATKACETRLRWSQAKTNHAYANARGLMLATYASAQLGSRRIPIAPVQATYAKMTPQAKLALLAQRPDPSMQTLLIAELRAAKINPANVSRDDARLMGNFLAARAMMDKSRADFSATK